MAGGPKTGFSFTTDLINGVGDARTQAKLCAKEAKDAKKEMESLTKQSKEASAEFKAAQNRYIAASQAEKKAQSEIRKERLAKAKEDNFSSVRGEGRDARRTEKEIAGVAEILRGEITLRTVREATELGEKYAKEAGAKGAAKIFGQIADVLPYVAAFYEYIKFAYNLVDEALKNAHKQVEASNEAEKAIGEDFAKGRSDQRVVGNEIYKDLKSKFANDFGGVQPGSDAAIEREKQIQAYADRIAHVAEHGADTLSLIKDQLINEGGMQIKDLAHDAGINLENVNGKYGLQKALLDSKNTIAIDALTKAIELEFKARQQREADQKYLEEKAEENDPTYAPRLRQDRANLQAYEHERLVEFQDWSPS